MPFTPESLDFLFENWSRNDREWYHEHKDLYRDLIREPFTQLMRDLQPTMLKIDPLMDVSEKRVSRVYRDARIVGNGPFFRDHIWCTMGRGKDAYWGYPCFYGELSPDGFVYGMGYYIPAPDTVEAIRKMILEEDETFLKAFRADRRQKVFRMEGEAYKRNHFPDAPEEYRSWLNRKGFVWISDPVSEDLLFSDKLSETVAKDFRRIAPIYRFLLKAENSWRGKAPAQTIYE